MLKFLSKLTVLLSFVGGLLFLAPTDTFAQNIPGALGMSAQEFVDKNFSGEAGRALANTFNEKAEGQVLCGNSKTICSSQEVCLRCKTTLNYRSGGTQGHTQINNVSNKGKCVPKEGFNEANLKSYWPDCEKKIVDNMGNEKQSSILSVEKHGFLNDGHQTAGLSTTNISHEFTDKDNKKYQIFIDGSKPVLSYSSEGFEGCEVLPVKIYNMRKCFFCGITHIIYSAANDITDKSFNNLSTGFRILLSVFFGLWIAILALRQVFPFTKKDASDFFEMIIKQSFKFMLAFYLLTNPDILFKSFIVPVLDTGITMGQGISVFTDGNIKQSLDKTEIPVASGGRFYNIKTENGVILEARIQQYLTFLQGQMSYMQAIGGSLICVGSRHLTFKGLDEKTKTSHFITGLRMMALGGILMVFGLLVSIVFAFYFLDAVMQLALVGAMLPLMIAGWPFKKTAKPASKGLEFILNSFFVFFFTGFVISVNLSLMNESIAYKNSTIGYDDNSGFAGIIEAMSNQNSAEIQTATDIGGIGFMLLIFSCLFGFMFLKEVPKLAGKLSGGAIQGVATQIGGLAGSMAKGAATKAVAPIAKGIDNAGGAVGMVSGAVKHAGNAMQDIAKASGKEGKFGKWIAKKGKQWQDTAKSLR